MKAVWNARLFAGEFVVEAPAFFVRVPTKFLLLS